MTKPARIKSLVPLLEGSGALARELAHIPEKTGSTPAPFLQPLSSVSPERQNPLMTS